MGRRREVEKTFADLGHSYNATLVKIFLDGVYWFLGVFCGAF